MVEKIMQKDEEDRPEDGNRLFKLPKHIKQIGLGGNSPEIYIEDYAEGYLRRLAGSDYTECRVAVLVGEFIKSEGKRYVFIRGAIEAEDVMEDNEVKFSSEVWANVYEKIKRYFPRYEAVGWFLGGPEFLTEVNDAIRQTHTDWFGGRDRVLYTVDPIEKESVFYLYDKGELKQWPGYCIYYEKNDEMQDYMVAGAPPSVDAGYQEPILAELNKRVGRKPETEETSENESASGEVTEENKNLKDRANRVGKQKEKSTDRAAQDIRERKAAEKKPGKSGGGHGTGIVAAVALLALGAFALREREQGQPGNAAVPTIGPTPTITGPAQEVDWKDIIQTNAEVKPTEPAVTQTVSGGSMLDDFIPVTETPFVPGTETGAQTITEAPKVTTQPTTAPEPKKEEDVISTELMKRYVVQSGDTLAGICQDFYGTTARMEEVRGINQIPDENWIYAGQELFLP